MWTILSGVFIGTAALMVAFWDEAKPTKLHPWLVEPQNMTVRAADKAWFLRARFRR